MLQQYTLSQLLQLQEEEDHIELKEAKRNFSYNGYYITLNYKLFIPKV